MGLNPVTYYGRMKSVRLGPRQYHHDGTNIVRLSMKFGEVDV